MQVFLNDINHAWPEVFMLSMACFVLVLDLFVNEKNRIYTFILTQIALLGAALLTIEQMGIDKAVVFSGTFVHDNMSDVVKLFIYLITAMVFLYSRDYLKQRSLFKGEYYVLGLFGVLGMMIMASANHFLTIYLGLELMSLCLYAMVAFNRDSGVASEAAMKYFVLGAIASGLLLYGMSMLYGATGSLNLNEIAAYLQVHGTDNMILSFGLVFIVVGLAFKLGAVPFHMWLPDVYHGAPSAVTLYIGSAPKIAAFAMVIRLLADGMQTLLIDWQQMMIIMAVLSLAIGNIVAIAQTNIKRMLAYSTISHAGFLILGILSGTDQGYSASLFYAITYAITAAGGFGIVVVLSRTGFEAEQINDYKGLNDRNPWMAFLMLLLMFSMAGVPPTVGFFAKLSVLQAILDVGLMELAVTAVLFSLIGAYYYIRIIKVMYFDKPETEFELETSLDARVVLSGNGLLVLLLGIFPGSLMALCVTAFA